MHYERIYSTISNDRKVLRMSGPVGSIWNQIRCAYKILRARRARLKTTSCRARGIAIA